MSKVDQRKTAGCKACASIQFDPKIEVSSDEAPSKAGN